MRGGLYSVYKRGSRVVLYELSNVLLKGIPEPPQNLKVCPCSKQICLVNAIFHYSKIMYIYAMNPFQVNWVALKTISNVNSKYRFILWTGLSENRKHKYRRTSVLAKYKFIPRTNVSTTYLFYCRFYLV